MIHYKKILEKYYNQHNLGIKPWELRKNDCNYQVNDLICFQIICEDGKEHEFNNYVRKITNVFKGGEYGLAEGYCILTLE